MTALLTGRGLHKRYAQPKDSLFAPTRWRDAVADVDIEIRRGETLAVIGESGSGKSTLVRMLLGLSRPTSGSVVFDGRTVVPGGASDERWLRRHTGIVLQDPYTSLDPRFTIGQSVGEPLRALRIPGDHAARITEVLDQVGLPGWRAAQYPHELSGGQRQRVAIARALVHGPKLLVGDEPLSALDVTVRAQILDLLKGLRERLGLTIALVSHDIGLVRHLADRVVVMTEGRVVETGPTERVLGAPQHPYTRGLVAAVPRLIERTTQ